MHPAGSVILFTVASGAGYGLLAALGVLAICGAMPAERSFVLTAFALALTLVTGGLLSSTFHLGHPERAWRALSQWRTSWLSREGVAAVVTYLPAGLFALAALFGAGGGALLALAALTVLGAAATVVSTAMIYASLRTIHAWHTPWTVAAYLAFAALSGSLLLHALARLWGLGAAPAVGLAALTSTAAALVVKLFYLRHGRTRGISDAASATRLGGRAGTVRLTDPPHSEPNYLMREMGFKIARKHAARLTQLMLIALFLVPFAATMLSLALGGVAGGAFAGLAVLSAVPGLAVERWLFFAEAKHTVTLYYGAHDA